jgi:hypothetical protein
MHQLLTLKCGQITNLCESVFFIPRSLDIPLYKNNEIWTLSSSTMKSTVHAVIQFSNPNYKAVGILPNIDYCGKYFAVRNSTPHPLDTLPRQKPYEELRVHVYAEFDIAERIRELAGGSTEVGTVHTAFSRYSQRI